MAPRVAISLARSGINVTGLDNSSDMLKIAKQKIASESVEVRRRITLIEDDMRHFQLTRSFGFIYIPASSFNHNISREYQKRILTCIWHHLKPDGILAFDLDVVSKKSDSSWWIDRKEMDSKMIVWTGFMKRKKFEKILSINLFFDVYHNSKLIERYHEYGEIALIFRKEIEQLLKETGFYDIKLYGNFDRSEYKKSSKKLL